MTSGNIAVFDHDALRHIDYVSEFHKIFGAQYRAGRSALCQTAASARSPPSNRATSTRKRCLNVKTLIRKTEATAAAMTVGVQEEKLHFPRTPLLPHGQSLQAADQR